MSEETKQPAEETPEEPQEAPQEEAPPAEEKVPDARIYIGKNNGYSKRAACRSYKICQ